MYKFAKGDLITFCGGSDPKHFDIITRKFQREELSGRNHIFYDGLCLRSTQGVAIAENEAEFASYVPISVCMNCKWGLKHLLGKCRAIDIFQEHKSLGQK